MALAPCGLVKGNSGLVLVNGGLNGDAVVGSFVVCVGTDAVGPQRIDPGLATGCRLSLSPPFVRPERLAQTLWRTALAGPFMLANEALACRRSGRMGDLPTAAAMLACGIWALAQGVILVSLASAATARL